MIWDARQRRYEDSRGRPLTPAQIRDYIEEFIQFEKQSVRAESEKLLRREIAVAAFFAFMRQKITAWHSISGQIAYGGQDEMTAQRWKRINEKIISEIEYLNDFEQQAERSFQAAELLTERVVNSLPLEVGPLVEEIVADSLVRAAPSEAESVAKKAIVDTLEVENASEIADVVSFAGILGVGLLMGGTIQSRAEMYTDATYATYENNVLAREMDEGVTLGRRISEKDGEVCVDCEAAATDEFVPLADLPEIGDSVCGPRCRCEFEFLTEGDSFRTSELFSGTIRGQERYGGDETVN